MFVPPYYGLIVRPLSRSCSAEKEAVTASHRCACAYNGIAIVRGYL